LKRIFFIIAILFAGISVQAQTQTYYWGDANHDGKIDIEDITILTDIILGKREAETFQIETKHDYVDLGLSVKWATCNVGAKSPEEFGDYFAWGETKTKTTYASDWSGYFDTENGGSSFVKYSNILGETVLDKDDDVASKKWVSSWRMPTDAEWVDLRNCCYWEWTDSYDNTDVSGYIVFKVKNEADKGVKKTGNSTVQPSESYSVDDAHIFLPAAGYYYDDKLNDAGPYAFYGYYWSSTLDNTYSTKATGLYLSYKTVYSDDNYRFYGRSIRPVCP